MRGKIMKAKDRQAIEQEILQEFVRKTGRRPHGMGEWMAFSRKTQLACRQAFNGEKKA